MKVNFNLWTLLIVYISIVFYFTIVGREPADDYKLELQPLNAIITLLNVDYDSHGQYIVREVLLNIGLLMPVGFLLGFPSIMSEVKFHKIIICGFFTSLTIETLQLITKTGTCEMDDLICNTFGCAISFLICKSNTFKTILQWAQDYLRYK